MKKLIYFIIICSFFSSPGVFGQKGSFLLSFRAIDFYSHDTLVMDSVYIENPARNCDTTLYGEPSGLLLSWVTGIDELMNPNGFQVTQNYPNPFAGSTNFAINLDDKEDIKIVLTDIYGKQLAILQKPLDRGTHTFTVETGAGGIYFLTVSQGNVSKTLKLTCRNASTQNHFNIRYSGTENKPGVFKTVAQDRGFYFQPGDVLNMTAYTFGHEVKTLYAAPTEDITFFFNTKPNLLKILATPLSGNVPLLVHFNGISNIPGIQNWHWNFGDGETSNSQSPDHTYLTDGTYNTVSLSITTNQGENISVERIDYIHVLHEPNFVNFTADYTYGAVPFTVNFTGFTNIDNVWSWQWNFGDGTTEQNIQNPTHIYQEAGTYHVALQIIAAGGTSSEYKANFIHALYVDPCPSTVSDADGNVYSTTLIGNQCWMAENLNVGTKIDKEEVDGSYQTDNGIKEKYCLWNSEDYCDEFGGLYQWDEAMQYVTDEGAQGICPDGWHIPTDEEWKTLEGFVDDGYPIGDPEWDLSGWRGYNAGEELKSSDEYDWSFGGTDDYNFKALPGSLGSNLYNYFFSEFERAFFWASKSSGASKAWTHEIGGTYENDDYRRVRRSDMDKINTAVSIRCIKD